MISRRFFPLPALLALVLAACGQPGGAPKAAPAGEGDVVNVYSGRHYDADAQIFKAFEAETGIEVRVLEAPGDQLIERLKAEGGASPADVVITADAGNLYRLKAAGLLQAAPSAALEAAIPANLRDPDQQWYGFSKRSRVIVYAKGRIDPAKVATYDALTQPALKGKVCARTSTNVYNLSLLAARIERYGADKALAWAKGVAANFARDPQGADTDQIKAVAAGLCDVAIVNHYYLVRMAASPDPEDQATAAKVGLVFPDQAGAGAHVNVSGAGLAANAPNKANGLKLLEFFAGPVAQKDFAALNDEFPVVAGVPIPAALESLGSFKADDIGLDALGRHQAEAQTLYDKAGWK